MSFLFRVDDRTRLYLLCRFRQAGNEQHPTGVLHPDGFESFLPNKKDTQRVPFLFGASVLIGLFKKRCHTNGFSDFRVADFLVFTLQAVPEVPKSKPTS